MINSYPFRIFNQENESARFCYHVYDGLGVLVRVALGHDHN